MAAPDNTINVSVNFKGLETIKDFSAKLKNAAEMLDEASNTLSELASSEINLDVELMLDS